MAQSPAILNGLDINLFLSFNPIQREHGLKELKLKEHGLITQRLKK